VTLFALIRVHSRLQFVALLITSLMGTVALCDEQDIDRRVYGMLIGSVVGDALGGPVEFAKREKVADVLPGYRDQSEVRRLGPTDFERLAAELPLLPYDPIRPGQEPYGQWTAKAPAGTCTDDTRNKIVLLDALRRGLHNKSLPLDRRQLAEAYLRFGDRPEISAHEAWVKLCDEGFNEYSMSARWILGERDLTRAAPPSRMWNGIGTCCGQMTLPPLAGLYPGDPEQAYRAAYELAFFDNGDGKDINAALIAGIAFAMAQPLPVDNPAARHKAWRAVLANVEATDPYRYGEVKFMKRVINQWIAAGQEIALQADGSPAKLYELIDKRCPHEHAWEARFLVLETVALAEFCYGEPLAAMHLALDYGQDTDSAAQLLGAIFGAIHGPDLFPEPMRQRVAEQLAADHGESLQEWVQVIQAVREP
jgi:ADP-ribosylglycohydrolase